MTKASWDEINENASKFEASFTKEFLDAVDKIVSDKDLTFDFKKEFVCTDLKFENKGLKKLNDKVLK